MALTKEEQDAADAAAAADKAAAEAESAAKATAAQAVADAKAVSDAKAAAAKAAADKRAAFAKIKHVVLTAPYGFYEGDGTYVGWSAGQVVTDEDEIAELIERKALVEVVSNE